jgi:uncharacterized membrane protein
MKAKLDKDLWLIDIVTILLIVVIAFSPSTTARIILGLPFLLFFPGYVLIAALFPKKGSLGGVERLALSFGLSIAMVPLIGLILNYTTWGIRLYPILISLTVFILVTSGVAWYRRGKLAPEERFRASFNIRLPSWRGQSMTDKVLSIILTVVIVGAIGTLGYVIATPKVGEKFTEFYILGPEGRAGNYPEELKVGEEGRVILGIVNHEQDWASYKVEVWIDGEKANLRIEGEDRGEIKVELEHEQAWEKAVAIVPQKAGENQKVEFVLYKDGGSYFEEPPYLRIDVEEA